MSTSAERLVEDFFDRVHGYVRLRVPLQDCEDLVGEIFVRAMQRHDQLRGDAGAWLFSIARSRVAEYYRQRGNAMLALDTQSDGAGAQTAARTLAPLEALEHDEFRRLLQRKMSVLSEIERDVIALKFSDGLNNTEIAAMLNISPNHLGVVLHRALQRLRDAMAEEVQ